MIPHWSRHEQDMVFYDFCDRLYARRPGAHFAIDVGLSSNAPQSAVWLERNPNLIVLGFEPLMDHVQSIKTGTSSWPIRVEPALVGSRLFLVKTALGNHRWKRSTNMYVTGGDSGSSSILRPKKMNVQTREIVSYSRLDRFLRKIPWQDTVGYVNYLKTDCQGYDLRVIKGAGKYLEKFAAVTIELESRAYFGTRNTFSLADAFMRRRGFISLEHFASSESSSLLIANTEDPTWVNLGLFQSGKVKDPIEIFQQG